MLPAASSPIAAPLRPGAARVLGALPAVLYLEHAGGLLALETARGAGLPIAWRLGVDVLDWGVGIEEEVRVLQDGIDLGGRRVRAVRAWRPARVRPVPAIPAARPEALSRLRAAIEQASRRIGAGPGLTPEADDEVCGLLLVAHACGAPQRPDGSGTTLLSAALLDAASRGYAVPPLARVADAWLAGRRAAPHDVAAVEALGATSGPALLRGLRLGVELIDRAAAREEERVHG